MILAAALLLMAQTIAPPPPPADDGVIYRESGSLTLPGKIAPALLPYLMCVNEAADDELVTTEPATTGAIVLAAQARAVTGCQDQRAAAKSGALTLLAQDARSAADREREVERALYSIEHAFDGVAETLDRKNNVAQGTKK